MRKNLTKMLNKKVHVTGTLERYGLKKEYVGGKSITILLTGVEVIDENGEMEQVDYAWLSVGKTLAEMDIPQYSVISMNCQVKEYLRGHVGFDRELGVWMDNREIEIGIQRASKIQIVKPGMGMTFTAFYKKVKQNDFISNKYEKISG